MDRRSATRGARLAGHVLKGPQWHLVDLLEARGPGGVGYAHRDPVILEPRRVGKTTGLFAVLVGRCISQADYQATYVAQSGVKSRERYVTLRRELDRHAAGLSGWKARESRGEERLEFGNGSTLRFLPPKAESFRGDAGDVVVLDEAQEIDAGEGSDLIGGLMPMFDTRPGGGQLVLAGTAGPRRSGLFWDSLVEGRAGRRGVLEYSAEDDADPDDDRVLLAAHPGIGTLTTLEIIQDRRTKMPAEQFAREYLGIWPADAATVGLTLEAWQGAGTEETPTPERLVLAFDVAPDRSRAAVAAAWRDEDGVARVEVLEARAGTDWLVAFLVDVARRYRAPVWYDAQGGALDVAAALAAARPKPDTHGLSTAAYAGACAGFVARVLDGRLAHHRQPDLDEAVAAASRRRVGDGLWAWGRRASASDISPLVAATVAVTALEGTREKPRVRRVLTATA